MVVEYCSCDRMIAVAFHRLRRWWIWWRSLHSRGAPDVCSEGWWWLGVCASRTIIINIFWQTWCLQESVQQCLIGKVASSVLRWFGGRRWKKYKWLKPGTWCKSMNVCKSHWISLWQSAISWTKNLCMPSLLKAMPMAHATALHRPYWVPRSAGAAMKDEAAWALMSVPNGS